MISVTRLSFLLLLFSFNHLTITKSKSQPYPTLAPSYDNFRYIDFIFKETSLSFMGFKLSLTGLVLLVAGDYRNPKLEPVEANLGKFAI
ncbi:hypothetical protein Hdeb2414_s0024g00652111 [Helianthus debilis subsp. tardiflorus]